MKTRTPIVLLILLLLAGCTPYRVTHQLPYGPGARQTYDFYEPRVDVAGTPRPVLLAIHGGGYVSGDKSWAEDVAERFCGWGYVVVAINYTLAGGPGGVWPVQLNDAQAALDHIRSPGSSWMRIREPVVGFGVSAGAHLAAALHILRDLPFAIGASGPWDFLAASNAQLDEPLRALLGLPAGAPISDAARADMSPVSWVTPHTNMLLIHAKRDPLTRYEHATRMEESIQMAGGKVELVTIDSDSHGGAWKDATGAMRRWLRARQSSP